MGEGELFCRLVADGDASSIERGVKTPSERGLLRTPLRRVEINGACGRISESCGSAAWADLVGGARGLRSLVRIKIEDIKDLERSKRTLLEVECFFDRLGKYAAQLGLEVEGDARPAALHSALLTLS